MKIRDWDAIARFESDHDGWITPECIPALGLLVTVDGKPTDSVLRVNRKAGKAVVAELDATGKYVARDGELATRTIVGAVELHT